MSNWLRAIAVVASGTMVLPIAAGTGWATGGARAEANAEGSSGVRAEIVEDAVDVQRVKARGAREVWIWDKKKLCYSEPGQYIYIGQPPTLFGPPNPREQVLALYDLYRISARGERTWLLEQCRPLPQPAAPRDPRPATPTTLTSRVEDWLKVPQPTPGLSAQGTQERPGLTGAELRLWVEGMGLWAPPPTTLDNTRVEVQAWPVEYRWSMGDGTAPIVVTCPGNEAEPTVAGSCAGSAGQPHAAHVFETKSSVGAPDGPAYTVNLQVVWRARYRVVDDEAPGSWTALPDRLTEASRPFLVEEVRAALVPDP